MAIIYGAYSGKRPKRKSDDSTSAFGRKKEEELKRKRINQALRTFREENPNAFRDGPIYTRFPYRKIK